jgi:hypothetical protein
MENVMKLDFVRCILFCVCEKVRGRKGCNLFVKKKVVLRGDVLIPF